MLSLPQHLPEGKRGKVERRLPASELEAYRLLGSRLKMLARDGKVHEGSAAFGCLAELATRGGAAAMTTAPQEVLLQLSPSSLMAKLRHEVAARERGWRQLHPPYSREWLLAYRPHCGGSPLRQTALHSDSAELRSRSASAVLADAARVVITHPKRASAPAAYKLDVRPNKLGVDWSAASAQ